jgi:hypothetical protein
LNEIDQQGSEPVLHFSINTFWWFRISGSESPDGNIFWIFCIVASNAGRSS